jgi:shikimate 5-dehydrogenase
VLVTGSGGKARAVRQDCEQRGDQVPVYDRQTLDIIVMLIW